MTKHTPGPWKAIQHGDDWWTVLKGAWDISQNGASEPGVVACAKYSAMTPEENKANAHLIAAAPELLEACKALPDFDLEDPDAADFKDHAADFMNAMRLARAAIAKAEGKADV